VARRLNKLGFKAAALEGGFDAWKARYPVELIQREEVGI
jgi:rhodanese-related sulfurtransferase